MVKHIVPVELENGVTIIKPLDRGTEMGGPMDRYVNSNRPVYFDPFNKMVENDSRELPDIKQWFEDMMDGNEYFVDDPEDHSNIGGSLGDIIKIARELRKAINRSVKSAKEELEFLEFDLNDEEAGMNVWLSLMMKASDGLEEIIDLRRSGIMNFNEYAEQKDGMRLKQFSESLRKLWLTDAILGGVIRRYIQFREFELEYAQFITENYHGIEGHKEWREKKWKQAHTSLYRALKAEQGGE